MGALFLGLVAVGPAPASADITWNQTVMLMLHIPLGGGQFFTTNYAITASGGAARINVKCFNGLQRIGPFAGVDVSLPAAGQVAQQTPTLLGVAGDLIFSGGVGWCWANNTLSGNLYDTQLTAGITTDLSPGGILNSGTPTFFVGTGLTQMGIGGDIPFFTTGGGAQNFAFLVNPTTSPVTLTLQIFNVSGTQHGPNLNRILGPRQIAVLPIPGVFGLLAPPTSGSVRITGSFGFLGWFLSQRSNGLAFGTLGLDINGASLLPAGFAP